jgi:hypothetical protein
LHERDANKTAPLPLINENSVEKYGPAYDHKEMFLSELIGFLTLSIVQYSKILKIREHNVSETESVTVPHVRVEGLVPSQLGPLERANLDHWTT